ncbi:iron-sulfur cluster assembly scaffold protein [Candidatus Woesearchaeota archaeon]|nr:iron-sulfur cluster assembly scaffold protein [Candidatus Woesearchaeota archaeon]
MYSKKVIEMFTNPKNVGEIRDPDGLGKVGNPVCGDVMWIYIKVGKDKQGNEIIKDIKFKTMGCIAAIASSEMTTELVKGKTLDRAMEITNARVARELKGLPKEKIHCSNLAADALHNAIKDYRRKKKRKQG